MLLPVKRQITVQRTDNRKDYIKRYQFLLQRIKDTRKELRILYDKIDSEVQRLILSLPYCDRPKRGRPRK